MPISGAGGTKGGVGRFFIGLTMMIAGGYLMLNSIHVSQQFHFGSVISRVGSLNLTTGMVMFPLIFGIGIMFYNAKNPIGWILTIASLVMLIFGVISTIQFRMQHMTAFELITILVLLVGGVGLFLSSFKNFE